jgi:hypothetical protein
MRDHISENACFLLQVVYILCLVNQINQGFVIVYSNIVYVCHQNTTKILHTKHEFRHIGLYQSLFVVCTSNCVTARSP